jgi:hypothetical protein
MGAMTPPAVIPVVTTVPEAAVEGDVEPLIEFTDEPAAPDAPPPTDLPVDAAPPPGDGNPAPQPFPSAPAEPQ